MIRQYIQSIADLSNYFALLAGLLAAFMGFKNFREKVYTRNVHKIDKYTIALLDLLPILNKQIGDDYLRKKDYSDRSIFKKESLDEKLADITSKTGYLFYEIERTLDKYNCYFSSINSSIKCTFFFAFCYCVFSILLIGLNKVILNENVTIDCLIFCNNVATLNCLIFLVTIFTVKKFRNFNI